MQINTITKTRLEFDDPEMNTLVVFAEGEVILEQDGEVINIPAHLFIDIIRTLNEQAGSLVAEC